MRTVAALVFVALAAAFVATEACAQTERLEQIDLMQHGFGRPDADCAAAIKRRDFRFIALDRNGRDVPGAERYRRVVRRQGIKYVKQPFWLFPKASDQFSFTLRARSYAQAYNGALLRYLASQRTRRRH